MDKWYRITNLTGGGADVFIYDEIGTDGIEATDFVQELGKVEGPINLHLNTPGGEVYDGIAIYTALKDREDVTVYVDSLAASIGSVIAMAGRKVIMAKHATMMIHDAFGGLAGNASDMLKMAERLETTSNEIASVYAERAGGTTEEWRERMKAESWYNAQQAVDLGLADEVAAPKKDKTKALAEPRIFNLSKFKNVPEWVKTQQEIENVGKVLSKSNLEQLHTGMTAMQKVHDAACDAEDCSMSMKAKAKTTTIKNHGDGLGEEEEQHLAGPCLIACLHEEMTDLIQDWLEDGYITMAEFLEASALITATVTAVSAGLEKIGIADRNIPDYEEDEEEDDDDGTYGHHTVTEYYGNKSVDEIKAAAAELDTVLKAKLEGTVSDKVIAYADHGTATGTWSAPNLSDFTDKGWDELDAAEKKRIAAHYTSQDGPKFEDLHLPHHRPAKSGIGPAVKAGVDAAKARVNQTQTGDSDAAMEAHLNKHQKQFGEGEDKTKDILVAADFLTLFNKAIEDAAKDDGEDCPTCKGTGKINEGNKTCPDCGGSGKVKE